MANIYILNNYPEEVIAHTFAKTSRASGSFKSMIDDLTEEKSDKFHSKWVIEYGHSSIAEHVIIHLAIEDISRFAAEAIEAGRLASYTEQSTRYQTKTIDSIYINDNWDPGFVNDYKKNMEAIFAVYNKINKTAKEHGKKMNFIGYDFARFLLPLSTKINLGLTINARALRRTLCKMLAHVLPEIRNIANSIHSSAKKVAPSLLRHVKPCNTTLQTKRLSKEWNVSVSNMESETSSAISVVCKKFDVDKNNILNNLAYEHCNSSFGQNGWTDATLNKFFDELDTHDAIPRAFEDGLISFEIVSDYGSYYDMKRHRMATLQVQHESLGNCGYLVPGYEILEKTDILDDYVDAMDGANYYHKKWNHLPESCYLIPNAFRIRYKMDMNPRELIEIIKLRGINKDGHTSYRFIGLKMLDIAISRCPELFQWLQKKLPEGETSAKMIKDYRLVVIA